MKCRVLHLQLLVVGFCLLTSKVQTIHASRTSINQETGELMSQEDLLFSIANESGPIIITAANWGYRTVLANWICRLVDLGMHKQYTVVVLTFDEPTGELVRRQYDSVVFQIDSPRLFDPKVPLGDKGLPHHISDTLRPSQYGAPDWNSVTAQKLSGVLSLVKTQRDVIFIDLDIALVRDPVPHILESFDYDNGPDFVFQTNVRDPPSCAQQEDSTLRAQVLPEFAEFKHINSGLYYLKSNSVTVGWLEHAIATCQKDKVDDQVGFMRATQFYEHSNRLKLFRNCSKLRGIPDQRGKQLTSKGEVVLEMVACVFHECEFPTGWATGRYPARNVDPAVELNLRWMQDRATSPYLYHPNFIQGMKNKVNKIKLKGLWVEDPDVCLPSRDLRQDDNAF